MRVTSRIEMYNIKLFESMTQRSVLLSGNRVPEELVGGNSNNHLIVSCDCVVVDTI